MSELHLAAAAGDRATVELLLAAPGPDATTVAGGKNSSPLNDAAEGGDPEDDNAVPSLDVSAVPSLDGARLLRAAAPSLDVNAKDGELLTPLHYAAKGGRLEVARLLTAVEGVNVNARGGLDHCTPLHYAAQGGHLEVVQLLLTVEGVSVNAKAVRRIRSGVDEEPTPLIYAEEAGRNQAEIVRSLLNAGAELDETLLAKWLTFASDKPVYLDLVEGLVSRQEITQVRELGRKSDFARCREVIPEEAPLGDGRLLTLGVVDRLPMHPEWAADVYGKLVHSELQWEACMPRGLGRFMRPAQKVPVALHACYVDEKVCGHRDVLEVLSGTRNMQLLSTPFVEAAIRHIWKDYKVYAFTDIILNVVFLAVALYASKLIQADEWDALNNAWVTMSLGCAVGKRCIEEASQLYSFCRVTSLPVAGLTSVKEVAFAMLVQYLCAYMKYSLADGIILFISLKGLFSLSADDFSDQDRFWLALWFASLWLRVVFSLRVVESVGTRFLPIFRAVQSAGSFFLVVGFFFLACVHAYYMLGVRIEPSPSYAAFLQVFRLGFLGDFDMFEFEGVDPTYVKRGDGDIWEPEDPSPSPRYAFTHAIFFIVSMGITLLLMNLLVGVLGAAYDVEEERAPQIYLQNLAMYVKNARCLPWVTLCCPKKSPLEPRFLHFLARESDALDTTLGTRAFFKSSIRRLLDDKVAALKTEQLALRTEQLALDAKLDARLAPLDGVGQTLDGKLAALKAEQLALDAKLHARLAPLDDKLTALMALLPEKPRLAASSSMP